MPRPVVVFALRAVALGGLAASCILTIGEDRKEQAAIEKQREDRDARPPPPRTFVFDDAGTVRDTSTGLEWQHELDSRRFAWGDAGPYCASLELAGGHWRLPSRAELLTVLKDWDDPFGAPHDWYWSSDIGVRPGTAWALGTDSWLNGNPIETKSRVRCVRGEWSTAR